MSRKEEPDLLEMAARILQSRDHSRQELRRKLLARGAPEEALDPLLQDLAGRGWLDDQRFARQFVREKSRRGLGRLRLLEELSRRGIDRDLARGILDEEECGDEGQRAEDLARRRAGLGKPEEGTARFLLRRGFAPEVVRAALRAAYGPGASGSTWTT